jgi:hypothetical protein
VSPLIFDNRRRDFGDAGPIAMAAAAGLRRTCFRDRQRDVSSVR